MEGEYVIENFFITRRRNDETFALIETKYFFDSYSLNPFYYPIIVKIIN